MTYNIDSIISELANGKSEGDIAKELSDMLNTAIAQKKQKEAEEAAARQKAQEKEIQRDIELIAESITEYLANYLYTIDCHNMAEYMDAHYEEMAQELTSVLMNLRTVMPLYEKLFVQQTEEEKAPRVTKKDNTKLSITLDNKGSTEYSDKMVDEILENFLRQIGK
jgi:hypothetical protein